MKILLIDDDPFMLELERLALTTAGDFEVNMSTGDPEEVEQLTRQNVYDLIVLDVSLGANGDGLELAKRFRNNAKTERVPIVIATAEASPSKLEKLLMLSGAHSYIAKPFHSLQAFVAQVQNGCVS